VDSRNKLTNLFNDLFLQDLPRSTQKTTRFSSETLSFPKHYEISHSNLQNNNRTLLISSLQPTTEPTAKQTSIAVSQLSVVIMKTPTLELKCIPSESTSAIRIIKVDTIFTNCTKNAENAKVHQQRNKLSNLNELVLKRSDMNEQCSSMQNGTVCKHKMNRQIFQQSIIFTISESNVIAIS